MHVSVIIPVLHEKELINKTICGVRAAGGDTSPEIIVVDGDAAGDTLSAITDRTVKGVLSEKGRGIQMNRGVAQAQGDILLFLHADTELPVNALAGICAAVERGMCVGGAFDLAIDDRGFSFRAIEKVASLRSRLTRVPYGDQAIFVRRDYFQKIGGYSELPLMEDVDLMRRIKRKGGRICIVRERVKTSGRRWRTEGVMRCTMRNWTIMLLYLLGASPEKLVKWYPQQSPDVHR